MVAKRSTRPPGRPWPGILARVTTLRHLVNSPRLGLHVLAGAYDLDRPLSWVAVSELDDPTPYLEGAELLLTTGVGRRFDPDCATAYVQRLVDAGVSGLGFGVGVCHDLVPEPLVAAAERAGLPLVEVDRPTPFIAVSKQLADLFAAERLDRAHRELSAMQALTAALVGPGGAGDVVARLARLVGGWAVVLDARGGVVHTSGSDTAGSDTAGGETEEQLLLARRVAATLRGRGRHASAVDAAPSGRATALPVGLDVPAGALVVGTPAGVDPAAPGLLAFVASLLTLDRERVPATGDLAAWARAAAVAVQLQLTLPRPPDAAVPFAPDARVRAALVHASAEEVSARLAGHSSAGAAVGSAGGGAAQNRAGRGGEGAAPIVLTLDAAADRVTLVVLAEPADAALAALDGLSGGVSEPVPASGLPRALQDARALARRSRHRALVTAGEALPTVQELLADTLPAFADTVLAPLRQAAGGEVLIETLRTWLGLHGQTVAAAAAMGVHRHTVRDRLRRSAGLLGRDLDDPQVRAELWLALTP